MHHFKPVGFINSREFNDLDRAFANREYFILEAINEY